MWFDDFLSRQFANPSGTAGRIVCAVMNRQNRSLYLETIRLLDAKDSDQVLDIGCGNGQVLKMLAAQTKATLTGIDPSSSMVAAATSRNRSITDRLQINEGRADSIPFADDSFTRVFSINTVYFWPDLSSGLTEIRRILNDDGQFVNTFYSNATLDRFSHTQIGYRRYNPADLVDATNRAGFSCELIPILGNTAYALLARPHG